MGYKCCKMPENARGCQDKWACCDQAPEEKGCQTVCSRCNIRWGHKPGCSWPEADDENEQKEYHDEDDDMKTNDYDEEHNPAIAEDIAEETQKQIDAELTPIPPLGAITNSLRDKNEMSTDDLL